VRRKSNKTSDQAILSALQAQVAQAVPNPVLKCQLLQQEGEWLMAFERHFEKLKALPRRVRRTLQIHWKQSLAGIALLLALGQVPALASAINVGRTCTLARAIVSANNDASPRGFCRPGHGADTIMLPAGSMQTLTAINNEHYGRTGLPVIRSGITIVGNGSTIKRQSGTSPFRLFNVTKSGNLTLRQITLSGGVASGSFPNDQGSAIVNHGKTTLIKSTVSGNSADIDAATLQNYEGNLAITNSNIRSNKGYGVKSFLGTTKLTNSTVANNSSTGVADTFGHLTVVNSTISGNETGVSGADSFLTLTDSTITGNASDGVEALYSTNITLNRSLISGNAAADEVEVRDNNVTARRAQEVYCDASSYMRAGNFNLFGQDGDANVEGFIPGPTDIVPTQALSFMIDTTLANNGGHTLTHALLPGCPAIDAVNNGTCPPSVTDQRGVRRPQDGNGDGGAACDIGSFEFRSTIQSPIQ
jgi:hypothetical protein